MKVAVIGTGYVGLCTTGSLAEANHKVISTDVVEQKIEMLNKGVIPIFEPGLDKLLEKNKDNIEWSTDKKRAVQESDIVFICVATPSEERARSSDKYILRHDLTYVDKVSEEIAQYFNGPKVIVDKSTVPVKTAERVKKTLRRYSTRDDFAVVSNPELLREGRAVEDCLNPDVIILGVEDDWAFDKMRQLYLKHEDKIKRTN